MLLFGEGRVYLSHLPLYRAPHDRQLVLAARLVASDSARRAGAPDPQAAYLADRRASGERVYTIEPERFPLRMVAEAAVDVPARFRATVYRGHFERGGTPILRDVVVEVERAVVSRALRAAERVDPDDAADVRLVLFGEPDELYVAHRVAGAPSYDQVARVELAGAAPHPEALARGVAVRVAERGGRPLRERPLRDGEAVRLRPDADVGGGDAYTARVARVVYLEFDDLAAGSRR
jgi:hypothetical protein